MKKIPKISDLYLWIERENQFPFLISMFSLAEGPIMAKVIGTGFKLQVCLQDNNKTYYLRLEKDLKDMTENHLRFLKKSKKSELKKIFSDARYYLALTKTLINRVEKGIKKDGDEYLWENFKNIMEEVECIGLYTTALPYFLLSALEKTTKVKLANYQFIRSECEYLRSYSQYPILQEKVLDRISESISKKIGVSLNLGRYLAIDEIQSIINNGFKKIPKKEIEKRKKCVLWLDNKTKKTFFSYDKKAIEKIIKRITVADKMAEIKGSIACMGTAKGKAKIVNSILDMAKVKKGDIIISRNTNPSLMPVLRICAAIVTDEGGIGCHAAIVSRELKIPCIIGTKTATRILKDGDMVEVNANVGLVKIIKKS